MSVINFSKLVGENLQSELHDRDDWVEWRYCYAAGRMFRDEYLERFSDRETKAEFQRRRDYLTPIPSYARLEVNRVKNALAQRFPDIIRRGGSKAWQEAVAGNGRGVDRRGSSMNSYTAKYLLPEALVMRRVGVLVDAPRVNGDSAADVPENFRPYLNYYPVEHIERIIPAPVESPSDWSAVMVKDINRDYDVTSGETTDVTTFRYYYLDPERGGRVTIAKFDEQGKEVAAPVYTNLEQIPFVLYDILESLIKGVCSYQIAHLNLISADTSYALDANYPFMVRQRGNAVPAHLIGEDDEVDIGVKKGLWYEKGLNAPAFISPDVGPMQVAMKFRQMFKEEVHELVTGALASLGEDGTMDAGLAFIGQCFEDGEQRLWDHWVAYEQADPSRRRTPQILYPEDWSLKTDEERLDEANKYIDVMNKLPGQTGKKEAGKVAYERLFRGRLTIKKLDSIKAEVDQAPYAISDADIVIKAKKEGIFSAETSALALGANEDEAEKAKKDKEDTQKAIAAAQMDQQNGGPGNPDASVDPNSNAVARQGDSPEGVQGRGEGQNNKSEESEENE
jgi:hypothetical protein